MTADPDWTFGSAWPYRPRWFTSRDRANQWLAE